MCKKPLRILIILLCAALLFSCCALTALAETDPPGEPTGPAEELPEPEELSTGTEEPECKITGEHTPCAWTDNGDGTHSAVCTICGEPLTESCDYGDPAVYTPAGNGTHEKACTVCGGKVTEECVYGDPVSAPPTQTEPGTRTRTCTVCGYVDEQIKASLYCDEEPLCEHEYGADHKLDQLPRRQAFFEYHAKQCVKQENDRAEGEHGTERFFDFFVKDPFHAQNS